MVFVMLGRVKNARAASIGVKNTYGGTEDAVRMLRCIERCVITSHHITSHPFSKLLKFTWFKKQLWSVDVIINFLYQVNAPL